jgi:AraC-like DNA-binding protein
VVVLNTSEGTVARDNGGVCGPGTEALLHYSPAFEHLILKISPQGLVKKLSALIDGPVDPPFRLTTEIGLDPNKVAFQRRLLELVIGEIDGANATVPQLILSELEQTLIVTFLSCNRHNYTDVLLSQPRETAPWQVRRAEQYIEQHWDQPITVEALALVSKTSCRSLFYSFKKSRGVSPMAFVKQVRLRQARAMLARPGANTSVTTAALASGFSNLGHFAKDYFVCFGEHPSDTLRASGGLRAPPQLRPHAGVLDNTSAPGAIEKLN